MKVAENWLTLAVEIASIPILAWAVYNFSSHLPAPIEKYLLLAAMAAFAAHLIQPTGIAAMPFLYATAMLYGVSACVVTTIVYSIFVAGRYYWGYRKHNRTLQISWYLWLFCGNICCSFFTSMAFNILKPVSFWLAALAMVTVSWLMSFVLQKPSFWMTPYFVVTGACGVFLALSHYGHAPAILIIGTFLWWTTRKWQRKLWQKEKGVTEAAPAS
jgi:hypothetical protein